MDYLINLYISFWSAVYRKPKNVKPLKSSQWLSVSKFVGFYLVLLVILGFSSVKLFTFYLASPPSEGESTGEYKNIYSKKKNENVLSFEAHTKAEEKKEEACCGDPSREKINNYRKDKRDLNAQEGMWRAANALVFLTCIQVIVGGATVWFLILTFRTQRSELATAELSRISTVKSERPYIFIDPICTFADKDKGWFKVNVFIRNHGKSPAISIRYQLCTGIYNTLSRHDTGVQDFSGSRAGYLPAISADGEGHSIITIQKNFSELFYAEGRVVDICYAIKFFDPIRGGEQTYSGIYEISLDDSRTPDLTGLTEAVDPKGTIAKNRTVEQLKVTHKKRSGNPSIDMIIDEIEQKVEKN